MFVLVDLISQHLPLSNILSSHSFLTINALFIPVIYPWSFEIANLTQWFNQPLPYRRLHSLNINEVFVKVSHFCLAPCLLVCLNNRLVFSCCQPCICGKPQLCIDYSATMTDTVCNQGESMNLSKSLRIFLIQQEKSREQLADHLNCSARTIEAYCANPRAAEKRIPEIAAFFKVAASEFIKAGEWLSFSRHQEHDQMTT